MRWFLILLLVIGLAPVAATAEGSTSVESQLSALKATVQRERQQRAQAAAQEMQKALKPAVVQGQSPDEIQITIEPLAEGVALRIPFRSLVPAAAFQSRTAAFVVFDTAQPIGLPTIEGKALQYVRSIEPVGLAGARALRFNLTGRINMGATRDGNTWIVSLKATQMTPRVLVRSDTFIDPVGTRTRRFPVSGAGKTLTLVDGDSGSTLLVTPITDISTGVLQGEELPAASILPTAQGIVVAPRNSQVTVTKRKEGLIVYGADVQPQILPTAASPAALGRLAATKIRDLATWRKGGNNGFNNARIGLLYKLSLAGEAERQARRWDLARFYLAYDFNADALGVLNVMAATDAELLNVPSFRALRGLANLRMRKGDAAADDLGSPLLDGDPEIWLWRAHVAEMRGQPLECLQNFARGSDIIALYPPEERAAFQLAAIRAALALGQTDFVVKELALFPKTGLTPHVAGEVLYQRGQLALLQGDRSRAAAHFARAQTLGNRRIAAMAHFAQVEDDVAHNAITPAQAIDRLERLRFAWRGDAFELDLLERLGALYLQVGQYRAGLRALKTAVSYFPVTDRTRSMAESMDGVFRDLFLGGKADTLPPVRALAIFFDFRDLTPLGSDGDLMIRKLADRLVQVDLLDRAAELLDHQVRYRLEGATQSAVAARLAMIHILNAKSDAALEILRGTRQAFMPDDIRALRARVEARALIDLDRGDEAEAILDGDTSDQANALRSDIYWSARDWSKLAAQIGEDLGRAPPGAALSTDDRRQLLRLAVAQTMLGDDGGLIALRGRYGPRMASGSYAKAFDVLTASAQSGQPANMRQLSEALDGIDRLDSPLEAYRSEFGANAVDMAAAAAAMAASPPGEEDAITPPLTGLKATAAAPAGKTPAGATGTGPAGRTSAAPAAAPGSRTAAASPAEKKG